ncbi:transcriptional regulator GutM [Paracoccus pacificus]|uniref:Transcriptional regulator GutM n=1 Tax=Paracoccus pacificus TaxID=1463598 RepID=A0ABW4R4L9_9RHOB
MELWKIALLALGVVWLLQSVGTWMQMRHFRSVMAAITEKWSDGHMGAGNSRGRFGKGVIAIVVTDPQSIVRKVMVMEGRSVFAKFLPLPEYEGQSLARLKATLGTSENQNGRVGALTKAVEQLEKAKRSQSVEMEPQPA